MGKGCCRAGAAKSPNHTDSSQFSISYLHATTGGICQPLASRFSSSLHCVRHSPRLFADTAIVGMSRIGFAVSIRLSLSGLVYELA